MKKFILILLVAGSANATWQSVDTPVVNFDASGNPAEIVVCAVDDVAGKVCVTLTTDDTGAPFALNGQGDLQNKAHIAAAAKAALAAARVVTARSVNKASQDQTARGKINLPVTPANVN